METLDKMQDFIPIKLERMYGQALRSGSKSQEKQSSGSNVHSKLEQRNLKGESRVFPYTVSPRILVSVNVSFQ